ncbi:MAG: hypothetical protein K6C36_09875 [Clostridia bacterium]|nr:hypothetical protein [Clostridia bacterium]
MKAMMKNRTAVRRAIIIALAFVFASASLIAASVAFAPTAKAADTYVSTFDALKSALQSGNYETVYLDADLSLSDAQATPTGCLSVPAGVTTTLNLNGHTITKDHGDDWVNWITDQTSFIISNAGNLTVKNGTLSISTNRTDMNASDNKYETGCGIFAIIRNTGSGKVTVGDGCILSVYMQNHYKTSDSGKSGTMWMYGVGVWADSTATTVLDNGSTVRSTVSGRGVSSLDQSGWCMSFAYGVYGGTIISNNTTVNVRAETKIRCDAGWGTPDKLENLWAVAYGLTSSGNITVNGGTYNAEGTTSNSWKNSHDQSTQNGSRYIYTAGVFYTGATPVIADGTITTKATDSDGGDGAFDSGPTYGNISSQSLMRFTVLHGTEATYDEPHLVSRESMSTKDQAISIYSTAPTAGSYRTEGNAGGASLGSTLNTTAGTYNMTRGMQGDGGNVRVHVVYRFFRTVNTSNHRRSDIVGYTSNGKLNYNGTEYTVVSGSVGTPAAFDHLSASRPDWIDTGSYTSLAVTASTVPAVVNGNYYYPYCIASYNGSNPYSELENIKNEQGTIMYNFARNTSGTTATISASSPKFIFVDFVLKAPTSISASATTLTHSFDNLIMPFSDIGVVVTAEGTDVTSEYDVAQTGSGVGVTWYWKHYGESDTEYTTDFVATKPNHAGRYTYKLVIASDSDSPFTPGSLNRYGTEITMNITVTPSDPGRGSIPANVTMTYGQSLAEVFPISSYAPSGPNNADCSGTLSWGETNSSLAPAAGSGTFTVTWTASETGYSAIDYNSPVTYTVSYTCSKKPLTVAALDSVWTYGDDPTYSNTTEGTSLKIGFTGLINSDATNDLLLATVIRSATYTVNGGSYVKGTTGAGTYQLLITDISYTPLLANYTLTYSQTPATLTINKRTVYAEGAAVNKAYDGSAYVTVNWSNYTNIYGTDDVAFTASTGAADSAAAGVNRVVTVDLTSIVLTGADAANYTPGISGSIHVTITKANPGVTVPSPAPFVYTHSKLLDNSMLAPAGYTPEVSGTWAWDASVFLTNPSVNTASYPAVFTPTDSDNYNPQYSNVTLSITPATVYIGYEKTVEFGAAMPNILSVTYSSTDDPSFDISYAALEGNITADTDYRQGYDAGVYDVDYDISDYRDVNGNYVFIANTGHITVVARVVTVTPAARTITYGDAAPASFDVTVTDSNNASVDPDLLVSSGSAAFSFTTDYALGSQVGTYSVTPVLVLGSGQSLSTNYSINYADGTLRVNKAVLTAAADDKTVTYGDPVPTLTISYSGFVAGDTEATVLTGTVPTATTAYIQGSSVKGDGYAITVVTTGVTLTNYTIRTVTGTLTVNKADAYIASGSLASTITYTTSLADAAVSGAEMVPADGTFEFNDPTATPVPGVYTTYTVTYTPDAADAQNYNPAVFSVTLNVNKKAVAGSLGITGSAMATCVLTADTSLLEPAYDPSIYVINWYSTAASATVIGTGTSFTLTESQVGNQVFCRAVALSGDSVYYTGSVLSGYTDNVTGWITPATIAQLTFNSADLYNGVYDGLSHGITVTADENVIIGAVTVKYNNSTELPTDAGTYVVTADVAAPGSVYVGNSTMHDGQTYYGDTPVYGAVSGLAIGTITIDPAPYTVIITIAPKDYDGNTVATVSKITQTGRVGSQTADDVFFDYTQTSFSFASADAGSNIAVTARRLSACMTGAKAGNYTIDGCVTIKPANIHTVPVYYEAAAAARTYEPGNIETGVTLYYVSGRIGAQGSSDVDVDTATAVAILDSPDAGEGKSVLSVTADLVGSTASNYYLAVTNIETMTATVAKATPVVTSETIPNRTFRYTDTLAAVEFEDAHWSWVNLAQNLPVGTNSYAAVFTPDDTDNYNTVSASFDITVAKGQLVITPIISGTSSMNVVYGSSKPNFRLSVTGTTGETDMDDVYTGLVNYTCSYAAGSPVGTYALSASDSILTSDNYNITFNSNTLTCVPRAVTVTLTPVSRAYEPGNTNIEITCSALSNVYAGDAGDDSKLALSATTIIGTANSDNAGSRTVTWTDPTLVGSSKNNYTLTVKGTGRVTISKADPTGVVWPTSATVEYGTALALAELEGGDYSLGDFRMYYADRTPTQVGTFNGNSDLCTVVYKPTDGANYNSLTKKITLIVMPAVLNPSVSISGSLQINSTASVKITGIPDGAAEYLTYEWYIVSSSSDYDSELTPVNLVQSGSGMSLTVKNSYLNKFIVCVVRVEGSSAPYVIEEIAGGSYGVSAASVSPVSQATQSFFARLFGWLYSLFAAIRRVFSAM